MKIKLDYIPDDDFVMSGSNIANTAAVSSFIWQHAIKWTVLTTLGNTLELTVRGLAVYTLLLTEWQLWYLLQP